LAEHVQRIGEVQMIGRAEPQITSSGIHGFEQSDRFLPSSADVGERPAEV
jgi:hypothetical protein